VPEPIDLLNGTGTTTPVSELASPLNGTDATVVVSEPIGILNETSSTNSTSEVASPFNVPPATMLNP
jgi:hypothetical protein